MNTQNPNNKRRIAVETAGMRHNKELEDAFVAGFLHSAEGFNGEWGTWTEEGLRLAYWTKARGLNAATISADPAKVIDRIEDNEYTVVFHMHDGSAHRVVCSGYDGEVARWLLDKEGRATRA